MASEENKQEAAEKAARAARQMRHAASNVGDAAEAATEYVKDEVTESAERSYEGIKRLGEKMIATEKGRAAISITVGVVLIGFGVKKLGDARKISKTLADELAKAAKHVDPDV